MTKKGSNASEFLTHSLSIHLLQDIGLLRTIEKLTFEDIALNRHMAVGKSTFSFIPESHLRVEIPQEHNVIKFTTVGRELLRIVDRKDPFDGQGNLLAELIMKEYGLKINPQSTKT